jgi:hypothetical protein
LSVLLNEGPAGFAPAPGSPYPIGGEAFDVGLADTNGDRRLDIFAATVNSVSVLLSDGHSFRPAPGSPFRAGPGAYRLALADLNGDGALDIAASSFESDRIGLLFGR